MKLCLRRDEAGLVLHEVLARQLQRLNPGVVDGQAEKLIKDLVGVQPSIKGNLETWDFVKGMKTVFVEVEGTIQGLEVLQERFQNLMAQGRGEFLPLWAGKGGDKAAEAVLEHFRDREPRHRFYHYVRELQELCEILSPDPFLRRFLNDYQELVSVYRLVRAAYEPGVSVRAS